MMSSSKKWSPGTDFLFALENGSGHRLERILKEDKPDRAIVGCSGASEWRNASLSTSSFCKM